MTVALMNTPALETERLILRAPEQRDFDAYAGYHQTSRSEFTGGPMPRDRAWRLFGHHAGHWALRGFGTFFLQSKANAAILGMVMAWQPEGYPEREVGWCIFTAEDEGRGYAHEAAVAVLAHVFGTLGWKTAVSYIAPGNARSIALAERLGAVRDPDAIAPDNDPVVIFRHSPGVVLP